MYFISQNASKGSLLFKSCMLETVGSFFFSFCVFEIYELMLFLAKYQGKTFEKYKILSWESQRSISYILKSCGRGYTVGKPQDTLMMLCAEGCVANNLYHSIKKDLKLLLIDSDINCPHLIHLSCKTWDTLHLEDPSRSSLLRPCIY